MPLTILTWTSLGMVSCYGTELKSNIFEPVFATCDLDISLMGF